MDKTPKRLSEPYRDILGRAAVQGTLHCDSRESDSGGLTCNLRGLAPALAL